jgi:hypothetical protein
MTQSPEPKMPMSHFTQSCSRGTGHARRAGADLATSSLTSAVSEAGAMSRGARRRGGCGEAQFCCCHFAELVPAVAGELRAAWGDTDSVARLVEQLLGGEKEVQLETDAVLEFVHLYMYLEEIRIDPDQTSARVLPQAN